MKDLHDTLKEYHFDLDENLIAKYPNQQRDASRLMVVDCPKQEIRIIPHFYEIKQELNLGDLLVFNRTRVSKRRIFLYSEKGRVHEALFLQQDPYDSLLWQVMLRKPKKLRYNECLLPQYTQDLQFYFMGQESKVSFLRSNRVVLEEDFERLGTTPIPPYFKRAANTEDEVRYQTIFADTPGSVAAPTAGLHFTLALKDELKKQGVEFAAVNLQIGYGTFSPISEEQWQSKTLHRESYDISEKVIEKLNLQKKDAKRIVSVGTTSLRVLESIYSATEKTFTNVVGAGETELFLSPGDTVQAAEALITNFHLPGSSLLLLVAAFAGKELILEAYHKAIEAKMRFFSYGDAMLILRA
ncbi:MAG: tRNA preQ1(34) S-adenosylmethionine ribosyltransferase-isomerase QueA [Spirochaetota bacterium]